MSAIYKQEPTDAPLPDLVKQAARQKPGISLGRIVQATILAIFFAIGCKAIGMPPTWAIAVGAAIGGCIIAVLHSNNSRSSV